MKFPLGAFLLPESIAFRSVTQAREHRLLLFTYN